VRFLADESCDFAVVTALRTAGHDATAIVEINPGAEDEAVLARARSEARVLLTEDKDFGLLAYAGGFETAGVVLIRFPAGVRSSLGQSIVDVVTELGDRIAGAFVVVEPGRARISRPRVAQPGK
jgi:predicted nuclease of predicted toxin-antitoxin system